jgi:hypothetical protein
MSQAIVLTFDYEIFFVGSSTVENCLIRPVDGLLHELDAIGARACFFVDAAHMFRMNSEPGASEDARRVNDQVARIVAAGHRVELHVHPQWLDATWQGSGSWTFPGYRSCVLGELQSDAVVDLMRSSADALTTAARSASAGYALQAFRAPGLCAQPFGSIAAGMSALGLTIDSSVAVGLVRHTDYHSIDYRGAPRDVCWRFESDPITPEPEGRFAELPITTVTVRPVAKAVRRWDRLVRPDAYQQFGDGRFMPVPPTRLWDRLRPAESLLTIESSPAAVLRDAIPRVGPLATFISHPKAMSPVSFEGLRWLGAQDVRFIVPSEAVAQCYGAPGAVT